MSSNKKLIRITTVPMALHYLLPGQMRFMADNGFEVLMISAAGKELDEVIEKENCRHVIVPMTRQITIWKDLQCLFQLIRIFKKEKPDIVHTHTPKAGLLGMLAAKYCGIPIRIHTVAGLPLMTEKGWKYQLLKTIEKITYAAASHIWPNSHSLLRFILAQKLANPKKLSVIAKGSTNGIDVNRFNKNVLDIARLAALKTKINYHPQNKYMLFIGRLVADKGMVELVNVFVQLQKENSSLKLILAGEYEPSLDPLPEEIVKEIENNPSIIHVHWVKEVEYYMSLADYFVFPSHREGFPNVLLQAGAMELPIICSNIAGNTDIVVHNETGLVFQQGNKADLKYKILQALDQKEQMQKMAKKLHQIVNSDYKREVVWQHILEAYQRLFFKK